MTIVQRFRELGLSIPGAIRAALETHELTVTSFAFKYQLRRQGVSRAISGTEAPSDRLVDALVAELGGNADQWKLLLHEAGRPAVAAAGA